MIASGFGHDRSRADTERTGIFTKARQQRPFETFTLDAKHHDDVGALESVLETVEHANAERVDGGGQ